MRRLLPILVLLTCNAEPVLASPRRGAIHKKQARRSAPTTKSPKRTLRGSIRRLTGLFRKPRKQPSRARDATPAPLTLKDFKRRYQPAFEGAPLPFVPAVVLRGRDGRRAEKQGLATPTAKGTWLTKAPDSRYTYSQSQGGYILRSDASQPSARALADHVRFRKLRPGRSIGHGSEKTAFELGGKRGQVLLVASRDVIDQEVRTMRRLKEMGVPVVELIDHGHHVDGSAWMVLKRYRRASKDAGFADLLTRQSRRDLDTICRALDRAGQRIPDLQFLVDDSGRLVVFDVALEAQRKGVSAFEESRVQIVDRMLTEKGL